MFDRVWRRGTVALGTSMLLVGALLAGCTGDDPEALPTPTATTSSTAPAPVKLRFAVYGDDESVALYQRIADAFTASHPDVTFEVTSTGDSSAAAESAIGAIGSGIDAPDVFLLDVDHLPDLVAAEAIQPVNQLLEAREIPFGDGIQRTGLFAFSAKDQLACMPNDVSPLVAFYNRQLVKPRQLTDEEGVPIETIDRGWRWETFVAAAEQAVARGAADSAKGGYLPPNLFDLTPFILSAGGDVVDNNLEPSQLTLSDGNTRDALKTLAAFTRNTSLSLTPADVEQESALDRFKDGRLGMLVGTRAMVPSLREAEGLSFDVAPLPRIDSTQTVAVMNGYCISAATEHVEAAADFIAYAVDGDGVTIAAASAATVPSSLDVLHAPEFLQPGQPPRNVQAFAEGARRAAPTPYSVYWPAARAAANSVLEQVLYGRRLDVTSEETPVLDALLEQTDEESKLIFDPPEPTESPTP